MDRIDPQLLAKFQAWADDADKSEENKKEYKDGVILNSAFEIGYVKDKAFEEKVSEEQIREFFSTNGVSGDYIDKYVLPKEPVNLPENSDVKKADRKYALSKLQQRAAEQLKDVTVSLEDAQKLVDGEKNYKINSIKTRNVDIDAIVAGVLKDLARQGHKEALGSQVEDVAAKVKSYSANKTMNSKENIRAMFTELSKQFKGFKKDVLAVLVGAIETYQKTVEESELTLKYQELRQDQGKTREEAYEQLKADFKGKGSYYSDILKDFDDNVVLEDARKEVFEAIDRQRVGYDADGDDNADVTTQNAKTKSRHIEKAIKKDSQLISDKWTKKIMRGRENLTASQQINFERSSYKAYRKAVASENRVARNKEHQYTKDEITKKLRHDDVFNHLVDKGLINPSSTEQGKFDITKLSEEIGKGVGADYVMNRQPKKEIAFDEMYRVIDSIVSKRTYNGNNPDFKLSKHDVKALAKLCGYEYDGKNFFLSLWKNTGGAVADMVVSAGTALATGVSATAKYVGSREPVYIEIPYSQNVPVSVEVVNNTSLKFTFTTNSKDYVNVNSFKFLKDLMRDNGLNAEQVQLTELANGFQVIVNKSDKNWIDFVKNVSGVAGRDVLPEEVADLDAFEADATKNATSGLLVGLGITLAILALRAALEDNKGEIGVTPTQFDKNTSYDEYIGQIASAQKNGRMSKEVAQALTQLAGMYAKFDENGNAISWDSARYKQLLNKFAGDGTELNKHELLNGLNQMAADMKQAARKNPAKNNEEDVKVIDTDECEPNQNLQLNPAVLPKPEHWPNYISRYYDCLKDHDSRLFKPNGEPTRYGTTMGKVINCITDGNYDLKRLQEITNKIETEGPSSVKNIAGFDYDLYIGLRGNRRTNTFVMINQKMPNILIYDNEGTLTNTCNPATDPKFKAKFRLGGKATRGSAAHDASNQAYSASITPYVNGKRGETKTYDNQTDFRNAKSGEFKDYKPRTELKCGKPKAK